MVPDTRCQQCGQHGYTEAKTLLCLSCKNVQLLFDEKAMKKERRQMCIRLSEQIQHARRQGLLRAQTA
jgi:hypothetical protein